MAHRKSMNFIKKRKTQSSDSDSDYEKPKKVAPKWKIGATTSTGRKSTGITRPYNLSPELSALMGAAALPRQEVVKKMWAMIKERNLFDPNNKQFAICDDELMEVIGVKRFRVFGMMKYLEAHLLN